MICTLSEQELWSGLDRESAEITEHLSQCPTCRERAAQFRAGIQAVTRAATPTTPPLPETIGSYRIIRRLGEGGMGIVYEGEQETPKRLVAIKVIRGGKAADEFRVRLFQREAETLARLKHPAIGAIYEAGRTDEGEHYFAMELVRGMPLNEYVRAGDIPRVRRLELFCALCEAINYAHQRGVIHRDLKPTNILVDADGLPKILDFGLARISDPEAVMTTMTGVGRLMGTLPYMSPEEASGNLDAVDTRSDVYSLGVMFYELLTDRLPYAVRRAAIPDAIRTICEETPRRPSSTNPTLRGDLDTICLKALEKEASRRYQSAAAMAEDIERYLTDQPILARRAGVLYRLRKFIVRHPSFIVLVTAAIVYGFGVKLWLDNLERERIQAAATLNDWHVLRKAVIERKLAITLRQDKRLDEAEPHFRNALGEFRALAVDDRTGPTLLELAGLLIDRNRTREMPADRDYEEAESLIHDALAIFEQDPATWSVQRRAALVRLRWLYGPEAWNEPELYAEVETELAELDSAAASSESPAPAP